MKPSPFFNGRPIRSLQTMLRVIGEQNGEEVTVVPDGIYGPQTLSAVARFQIRSGLPATGVADQATWDAIVAAYEPALILVSEGEPIQIVLNPNQVITAGQSHPHMYLVQSILTVLSQAHSSIPTPPINGVLDAATAESLSMFQQLNQLPATGDLDKVTWKHLALQYPVAVNLITETS